jgi:hypothetical protein
VFFRCGEVAIAVESKFLEYFLPKKAKFADSYTRKALPFTEECWWKALEYFQNAGKRNLDVAQLIRHYFGISQLLHIGDASGWKPKKAMLLYLFWEPDNAEEIAVCRQHRNELQEFSKIVEGSRVDFCWLSYPELWRSWLNSPSISGYAENLQRRYSIRISS